MSLQNPTVEQKEFLLTLDLSKVNAQGETREYLNSVDKKYKQLHRTHVRQNNNVSSMRLRDERYTYVNAYKLSKGCASCGYNKCDCALSFHHKDGNKLQCVSVLLRKGAKFEIIKEEMNKYIVLCRNCHAELHALDFGRRRSIIQTQPEKMVEKQKEMGDDG